MGASCRDDVAAPCIITAVRKRPKRAHVPSRCDVAEATESRDLESEAVRDPSRNGREHRFEIFRILIEIHGMNQAALERRDFFHRVAGLLEDEWYIGTK